MSSSSSSSSTSSASPSSTLLGRQKSRLTPLTNASSSSYTIATHTLPLTPYVSRTIWQTDLLSSFTWIEDATATGRNTGLAVVWITKEKIVARMRVSKQHQQPAGLLHGGFSALIAEELGSIHAAINVVPRNIVGINISASHIGSAKIGDMILCISTPVKRGGTLQIWRVDIYQDEEQKDVNAASEKDPLFYLNHTPKGRQVATCQLTTMVQPGVFPGFKETKLGLPSASSSTSEKKLAATQIPSKL